MDIAKQRIRAATARKRKRDWRKGWRRETCQLPNPSTKKTVGIPGDTSSKGKSSLKPSHSAGKAVMSSSGPIPEGPSCLLTHKAYAVREVGSFVKPTDLEPCDFVGTEYLGASTLFDITRVCLLFTRSVWFYLLLT